MLVGQVPLCDWGKRRFQFPLGVALVTLLAYDFFLAAQSRKIPSAFSESKWIALAAYVMLGSACMYAGAVTLGNMKVNNPVGFQYFFVSLWLFNVVTFTNLLFVPKFVSIWKKQKLELTDITKTINMEAEIEMRSAAKTTYKRPTYADSSASMAQMGRSTTVGGTMTYSNDSHMAGVSMASTNPMKRGESDIDGEGKRLSEYNMELEKEVKKLKQVIEKLKRSERGAGRNSVGKRSLPSGDWNAFEDEEGREYYYNSKTEVCQYEFPTR